MKVTDISEIGFIRMAIVSEGEHTRSGDIKRAIVTQYGKEWQIKYDHNGARKNVPNYIDAVKHLQKQGW